MNEREVYLMEAAAIASTHCTECARLIRERVADAQSCHHRLVDARNGVVESGYLCVDCGAVFAAADHK